MTKIESKKVSLTAEPQKVFDFVMDLNNLYELLPQDKISDWSGATDKCSFKVSGGYKIGLQHKTSESPGNIVLESTEGSAMKFDLDIRLNNNESGTEAGMTGLLDVNPFMKMMIEKPLKNLFDYIAGKLEERFN